MEQSTQPIGCQETAGLSCPELGNKTAPAPRGAAGKFPSDGNGKGLEEGKIHWELAAEHQGAGGERWRWGCGLNRVRIVPQPLVLTGTPLLQAKPPKVT